MIFFFSEDFGISEGKSKNIMAQQLDKSLYYAKLNLKSTFVFGLSLSNIDHISLLMEIYVTQENFMQKF